MRAALRRYVSIWPGGETPDKLDLGMMAFLTVFILFNFGLLSWAIGLQGLITIILAIGVFLIPVYVLYRVFKWAVG